MKKIFILTLALAAFAMSAALAAPKAGQGAATLAIPRGATVAVSDFGVHVGAATHDINVVNVGKAAGEYIIERLVDDGRFQVIDRESAGERLEAEGLALSGIVDADAARRAGNILGVEYLIYGNVNDVTVSDTGTGLGVGGVAIGTTKSHIIIRMMRVATGDIVMASKGEGKSKTSFVSAGTKNVGYITIGTNKVTQDSVHNAVQKAAYQAADILTDRVYGAKSKKK